MTYELGLDKRKKLLMVLEFWLLKILDQYYQFTFFGSNMIVIYTVLK